MLRFSWRALNWKAFKLEAENKMLYYKKNPINVFFLLDNNLKPLNVWIGPITSAALRTGPCCLCLVLFTWYDSGRSHQAWSEFCSPLYQNTKISCVSGFFLFFHLLAVDFYAPSPHSFEEIGRRSLRKPIACVNPTLKFKKVKVPQHRGPPTRFTEMLEELQNRISSVPQSLSVNCIFSRVLLVYRLFQLNVSVLN